MNKISCAVLAVASLAVVSASSASAQGGTCERLWVERNSIYKDNGYCFKTARAIRYFGNAGCRYEYEGDIPMTRGERARIAAIVSEERALGCR